MDNQPSSDAAKMTADMQRYRGQPPTSAVQMFDQVQTPGVVAVAAGFGSLLDKLEADLRSIKDHANESGASSPPDGYEELDEILARPVADRCWQNGLDAMEAAIRNWIYDQRHNEPNGSDQPPARG
jgi:hypothetical protein